MPASAAGPGSGVVAGILNMFNISDTTPDPDPDPDPDADADIKCSHDGIVRRTVRRTVPSCEHHIRHTEYCRERTTYEIGTLGE